MKEEKSESGIDQEVGTPASLINSKNHRPGRELDVLVAEKVMGYQWWRSASSGNRCLFLPGKQPAWFTERADGTEPLVSDWKMLSYPAYSTDMTTALALVESGVATPGFRVHIGCSGAGTYDVEWSVSDDEAPDDSGWLCIAEECDVESLPLAICLAAISPFEQRALNA